MEAVCREEGIPRQIYNSDSQRLSFLTVGYAGGEKACGRVAIQNSQSHA